MVLWDTEQSPAQHYPDIWGVVKDPSDLQLDSINILPLGAVPFSFGDIFTNFNLGSHFGLDTAC